MVCGCQVILLNEDVMMMMMMPAYITSAVNDVQKKLFKV